MPNAFLKKLLPKKKASPANFIRKGQTMRIRMISDNKIFSGTPSEIVHKMHNTSHEMYGSLEEYMQDCCARLGNIGQSISITGDTEEERCLSLLQGLVQAGYSKVEIRSPGDVDRFSVVLLRGILGFSQERLAREIGVAFATVNRWERGKTRPSSEAIVSRIAKKIIQQRRLFNR
jgi:DNA-binding transcriptional regulator YiaG